MDNVSKPRRSEIMSKVRSANTAPERVLWSLLDSLGVAYERNYRALPGKPDAFVPAANLAVFADGDFWHGRTRVPRSNRAFWLAKFRRNRRLDARVDRALSRLGVRRLRLRESALGKSPGSCLRRIVRAVEARQDRAPDMPRDRPHH